MYVVLYAGTAGGVQTNFDNVRLDIAVPIVPSLTKPWIGVFHAGSGTSGDPWSFTDPPTNTIINAANPGWGEGSLGDQPIAGDWDGDGSDGIAVFRSAGDNKWYFSNNRTSAVTDFSSGPWGSGTLGDIAVAGDWDGDGIDGVGVFRTLAATGNNWFLADNPAALGTNYSFAYGSGVAAYGDLPVAGDWDGDGFDTIGVFRTTTNTWHLSNALGPPTAFAFVSQFAQSGDVPVAEDWNGDGTDDVGLYRPSTGEWFFDTNFDGFFDFYNVGFGGAPGDIPLVGHFVIPEPSTFLIWSLGLIGLAAYARRRRTK
jgi:hypothetical protein